MPKLFNHQKKTSFKLLLSAAMLFSLGYAPVLTSVGFLETTESVESEETTLETLEAAISRKPPATQRVCRSIMSSRVFEILTQTASRSPSIPSETG